jgi:hypothetical protein
MSLPALKIYYERETGLPAPKDSRQLIIELKRLMKGFDEDGVATFSTGGRVHLAEGSEDIVEPSKSMQVDTTTKGLDLFTIDDFKNKAEIYVGAYHNKALPLADIKSALNKFTQKGIDDGTFSADDAIKIVQDLKFQFQDRAQKQRLRDNIIAGTGTVDRKDFSNGSSLMDEYLGVQKEYQKAVDDGFQGTFEEFLRYKSSGSFAEGGTVERIELNVGTPSKKELEIAEKVYGIKPEFEGKTGLDLWKAIGSSKRSKIREGTVTGEPVGMGKLKKNQLSKDDFVKLANQHKGKTFKEFAEILKGYKTRDGKDFTTQNIAERIYNYNLKNFFKRDPGKGASDEVKQKAVKKRAGRLEKTAPFKASGTPKFAFHHIMPIGGEVPLTTNDIAIINQRMNSVLGGYNRDLNSIADGISNAYNKQPPDLKRIEQLNKAGKSIVEKAIKELPKEYRNLIGFNQLQPVFDEYGTVINLRSEKIGGVNQKKPGIKLEELSKEQAKNLRKQIKTDALKFEKAGLKDTILSTGGKILKTAGKVIKPIGYAVGTKALFDAQAIAKDQGIELSKTDLFMALDSGDPEVAINNAKRRMDPEFAAAERAKDLAKMTDDFEEVGQSTFGKYNDQIKNIKLP